MVAVEGFGGRERVEENWMRTLWESRELGPGLGVWISLKRPWWVSE